MIIPNLLHTVHTDWEVENMPRDRELTATSYIDLISNISTI